MAAKSQRRLNLLRGARCAALAGALALGGLAAWAAPAGPMDFLFLGGGQPPRGDAHALAWKVGEFSAVRLQPREAGSAPNSQPAKIEPEALRAALATIQIPGRAGNDSAAFSAAELADLVPALSAAFAAAGPDEDVLLLSTSRRNDGPLTPPKSATVRLFIADGRLQFIAHDLRADAWVGYQASHIVPALAFGSRNADSGIVIQSTAAVVRRGDWLALNVAGLGAPAAAAAPVPATASVPSPAPTPATSSAPPARDSAFYEQQELRLRALTRLRDQGLITPQEFEAKRRAIVDAL